MVPSEPHANLLAGDAAPTLLPEDPAVIELIEHGRDDFLTVVSHHPASSMCWALLAEGSLLTETQAANVAAYAYARTGYHRGLDALRKAGWRGSGPIPWEHEPNQGFLRSVWALSVAAERIGDHDEAQRCVQFLRDSSEQAWEQLSSRQI